MTVCKRDCIFSCSNRSSVTLELNTLKFNTVVDHNDKCCTIDDELITPNGNS